MNEKQGQQQDARADEGECKGCEGYGPIDEMGLCKACTAKVDRDLIRLRDWEYSVSAFGVPRDQREDLRNRIIKEHGRDMELLAEEPMDKKKKETQTRKKAKRKKSRQKASKR